MKANTNTSLSALRPPRPDFSDKTTLKRRVRGSAGSGVGRDEEKTREKLVKKSNTRYN